MVGWIRVWPVLLCLLGLPGPGWAAEARLQRVSAHAYVFKGDFGLPNSGVVLTPEGVVVVDTQWSAAAARQLMQAIRRLTDLPVRRVLLTHGHPDHMAGNAVFKEAGAEIVAHEAAARDMRQRGEALLARLRLRTRRLEEKIPLVLPDRVFTGTLTFRLGGVEIRAMGFPHGHAPGDAVVSLPQERVLFAGDLVMVDRFPRFWDASSSGWLQALDALAGLPVETLVPGHGILGGRSALQRMQRLLQDLRAAVARALSQGVGPLEAQRLVSLPAYRDLYNYAAALPGAVGRVYEEMEFPEEEGERGK